MSRQYLDSLIVHGIKLGLENVSRLLDALGNPHRRFVSVHVAGTNGKGSVVAQLDAMLCAAGYRTGRYTSPHLVRINERLMVNRKPIADDELDAGIERLKAIAEPMSPPPTYFEFLTALAFQWLAEQRVDIALVEVGMGGRFDATNVLSPAATAVTSIALEHTRYLGNTIEAIAFEKAGILKPGCPVVLGDLDDAARAVILTRAEALGAPAACCGDDFRYSTKQGRFSYDGAALELRDVLLALPGRFQGANAAVAVALAESLRGEFNRLDASAVTLGLRSARWPCRLERVLDQPPVIIDVAHNPAGARVLADELRQAVVVLAVAEDKAADAIVEILAPVARPLILTQFPGDRAMPLARLITAAGAHPHEYRSTLEDAIDLGLSLADARNPLVITGSFHTAGLARQHLSAHHGASPLSF